MKDIYGTGPTKVRLFGVYRTNLTLVLLLRLHLKGEEFREIMKDIVANDFERTLDIFEERVGGIYTLYTSEEKFSEDIADGREVLRIGVEDTKSTNRDTFLTLDNDIPSSER